MVARPKRSPDQPPFRVDRESFLNAIPSAVIVVDREDRLIFANAAAEGFFQASESVLCRMGLSDLIPFGHPVLGLVAQVREWTSSMREHGIEIDTPRTGRKALDVQVGAVIEAPGHVMLLLEERTIAQKMNQQFTTRGAARSIVGMAQLLAHEIKNPLSGIRGAAQLLEQDVDDDGRVLTSLIRDEADRIRKLVDRMEDFGRQGLIDPQPVNIHAVLEHVRRIAQTGFASHVRILEDYDPSLPPVPADRDQLVQVFLNLVKNAAEACPETGGEIVISTAYRHGVRLAVGSSRDRLRLPLEVTVRDNGAGIPEDLQQHLFDPFVTTKANGSGLGLALVAKIVGDHGGVVECDSEPKRTVFRVMLPVEAKSIPVSRPGIGSVTGQGD